MTNALVRQKTGFLERAPGFSALIVRAGAEAQRRYLEFFAALRHLFDWLVTGHVLFTNTASFVRGTEVLLHSGRDPDPDADGGADAAAIDPDR